MINLYLLELQDLELAQELKEGIKDVLKAAWGGSKSESPECIKLKKVAEAKHKVVEDFTRKFRDMKLNCLGKDKAKCIALGKQEHALDQAFDNAWKYYKEKCKQKKLKEAGFEGKPHGWTDKSIKKAGTTLARHVGEKTPNDKGFFDKCVAKIGNKMKNPEGYCASLKDEASGSTYWKGKDKTKKEAQKDIAKHKNV